MRYNVGLLYTPSHGYAGFTVPHFDRFMLRAVPQLDVPPGPIEMNESERVSHGRRMATILGSELVHVRHTFTPRKR